MLSKLFHLRKSSIYGSVLHRSLHIFFKCEDLSISGEWKSFISIPSKLKLLHCWHDVIFERVCKWKCFSSDNFVQLLQLWCFPSVTDFTFGAVLIFGELYTQQPRVGCSPSSVTTPPQKVIIDTLNW